MSYPHTVAFKKKSTFLVDEKLTMTERSETGNWGACNCD